MHVRVNFNTTHKGLISLFGFFFFFVCPKTQQEYFPNLENVEHFLSSYQQISQVKIVKHTPDVAGVLFSIKGVNFC